MFDSGFVLKPDHGPGTKIKSEPQFGNPTLILFSKPDPDPCKWILVLVPKPTPDSRIKTQSDRNPITETRSQILTGTSIPACSQTLTLVSNLIYLRYFIIRSFRSTYIIQPNIDILFHNRS